MANYWLELDREALRHNARQLRALVAPARMMPVVKANYYGAGATPIARELAAEGVDAFAVAAVREAIELRAAGVRGRIVVLTYFDRDDADAILVHAIEPVVFTPDSAAWLSERADTTKQRARVWVKVDTGLGRLGVPFGDAADFARGIAKRPGLEIAGLLSTLAENPERTRLQMSRLTGVRDELRDLGALPLSLGSTQGLLTLPASALDVARPGIALLGVVPHRERLDGAVVERLALRPIVTWKARVAYVKRVPAGEQVGYGVRAPLARDTSVATLAVGWADGYHQALGGVGHVLLRGRRCPILAMSANSTLVDLSGGAADVAIGDEAVLLGRQGAAEIEVDEIAQVIGSFYRVLAGIPAAVPRILV
jgi:alanine racemase